MPMKQKPVWSGQRRIPVKRLRWPLIIDQALHVELKERAKEIGVSMSWFVCDAIRIAIHGDGDSRPVTSVAGQNGKLWRDAASPGSQTPRRRT